MSNAIQDLSPNVLPTSANALSSKTVASDSTAFEKEWKMVVKVLAVTSSDSVTQEEQNVHRVRLISTKIKGFGGVQYIRSTNAVISGPMASNSEFEQGSY